MSREEMLNEVIHKWGFENENTIWFAEHMETDTDEELIAAFEVAMNDKKDWDFL